MKKWLALLMAVCLTACVGCNEIEVKEPQKEETPATKYELSFSNGMAAGDRFLEDGELAASAQICELTDIFDLERLTVSGELLANSKVSGIGLCENESFVVGRTPEEDTLYSISSGKAKAIYTAEVITPIFEKDGAFIFAINEKNSYGIDVMKYSGGEKTIKRLFHLYETDMPTFTQTADYISVTQNPSEGEALETWHFSFDRAKKDIKESGYVFTEESTVVPLRNAANNFFMTYNYASSQILVEKINSQEFVSEITLDVWNKGPYLNPKIFGKRLFFRDASFLKVHDFEDGTDKVVCKEEEPSPDSTAIYGFGSICEMVGEVLIFSTNQELLAYDFANNRLASICPLDEVEYTATDNTKSFLYSHPSTTKEKVFFKLKLKAE